MMKMKITLETWTCIAMCALNYYPQPQSLDLDSLEVGVAVDKGKLFPGPWRLSAIYP
jgi:hypothetical protein